MVELIQKVNITKANEVQFMLEPISFLSYFGNMLRHPSWRKLLNLVNDGAESNYERLIEFIGQVGYNEVAREKEVVVYRRGDTLLGLGVAYGIIPIETQTTEVTAQQDLEYVLQDAKALGEHYSGFVGLIRFSLPKSIKERLERYTIGQPVLEKLLGEGGYKLEPKKDFLRRTHYTLVQANAH